MPLLNAHPVARWLGTALLAVAISGCNESHHDHDAGAKPAAQTASRTTSDHAPTASSTENPQHTPANRPAGDQPQHPAKHSARGKVHQGLTAADCTQDHWTRIRCAAHDNACAGRQIDLMGKYKRCEKAGLLEKQHPSH